MQATFWGVIVTLAMIGGTEPPANGPAGASNRPSADPQVMKFKEGKSAAFSMQFDDSMETQADFAIPEMNKRGLVGTFFVNPATARYERRRQTWEVVCPKHGHELANHTLHHTGAADYDEADREIGGCARQIWKLYPQGSKLRPFLGGGGTTWSISPEQRRALMDKYFLFRDPSRVGIADDRDTNRPVVQARQSLEEGQWGLVGFHGIGGQWISTSEKAFVELLDFLVENKDRLWTGTTADVYRYVQERDSVKAAPLTEVSERSFRLAIECDPEKVNVYGRPFTELYDVPLTVQVPVPASWRGCTVKQAGREETVKAISVNGQTVVRINVRPNIDPALVTAAE
jgi:hypothetical protein